MVRIIKISRKITTSKTEERAIVENVSDTHNEPIGAGAGSRAHSLSAYAWISKIDAHGQFVGVIPETRESCMLHLNIVDQMEGAAFLCEAPSNAGDDDDDYNDNDSDDTLTLTDTHTHARAQQTRVWYVAPAYLINYS